MLHYILGAKSKKAGGKIVSLKIFSRRGSKVVCLNFVGVASEIIYLTDRIRCTAFQGLIIRR